jgi:hypothetical protein
MLILKDKINLKNGEKFEGNMLYSGNKFKLEIDERNKTAWLYKKQIRIKKW